MVVFNLDPVSRAVFVTNSKFDLQKFIIEAMQAINAHRDADKALHEVGILNDHRYFAQELAYSRTERVLLKIRHGVFPPLDCMP